VSLLLLFPNEKPTHKHVCLPSLSLSYVFVYLSQTASVPTGWIRCHSFDGEQVRPKSLSLHFFLSLIISLSGFFSLSPLCYLFISLSLSLPHLSFPFAINLVATEAAEGEVNPISLKGGKSHSKTDRQIEGKEKHLTSSLSIDEVATWCSK
jgi:hypothetical protein